MDCRACSLYTRYQMKKRLSGMGLSMNSLIALSIFTASSSAYAFPYKGTAVKVKAQAGEVYDDNVTFLKDEDRKSVV